MKNKIILLAATVLLSGYACLAQNYASLQKELDGGYYTIPTGSTSLFFKIYGEYNQSTLSFKVYDDTHAVVTSPPISISSVSKQAGNNEYSINTSSMAAGYYVLEVTNEKKEKLYLRFKK